MLFRYRSSLLEAICPNRSGAYIPCENSDALCFTCRAPSAIRRWVPSIPPEACLPGGTGYNRYYLINRYIERGKRGKIFWRKGEEFSARLFTSLFPFVPLCFVRKATCLPLCPR